MYGVVRNEMPKDSFLSKVRKLANKKGIILIFDECTSGSEKILEDIKFIKFTQTLLYLEKHSAMVTRSLL